MNDTTVLITSVNTCNCPAGNHVTDSCFPRQQRSGSMTTTVNTSCLSDDNQTAERTATDYNVIVLSRDPMVENTVYEVKNQFTDVIAITIMLEISNKV